MSDVQDQCYSCSSVALLEAIFGEEEVVYHRPSGETHFLNASGSRIIRRLLESPACLDDLLAGELVDNGDLIQKEMVRSQIADLIRRFCELGIVVPRTI